MSTKTDVALRPGGLRKFEVTDREQCGLLINNEDNMIYVVKVPNRSEDDNAYLITKDDYDAVENVLSPDEEIVGFMHTHLPGDTCEPSDGDFDGAELHPDMMHLIYSPSTKEHSWYGASGGGND